MNKLMVKGSFKDKLNRLPKNARVGDLSYRGKDLSAYEGRLIVAIVGTRKPTPYGIAQTKKIASELANAGVVIVSGLALGVDCLAHDAALASEGSTIAIVPRNSYPKTNGNVAKRIVENGNTIISDDSQPNSPIRVAFLNRNRIVAAISDVIIIPEAAEKSGSLNTAHIAMKMRIPVCVFPGNITSPMSAGTNQLLKEGAHAITETQDVLNILGIKKKRRQLSLDLSGDTPEQTILLQKIALGHTSSDDLLIETMLDPISFQTASTMLEIDGKISQDSLGKWSLT